MPLKKVFVYISVTLRGSVPLFCKFFQGNIWFRLFEFQNCLVERNKRVLSLKLLKTKSC